MIPKKQKLRSPFFKKNQYERGLKRGFSEYFSCVAYKTTDSQPKFAVVVSKKIANTAPGRNKIKRRVFSLIKDVEKKFQGSFVFYTKKEISKAKFCEIKVDFDNLISRL